MTRHFFLPMLLCGALTVGACSRADMQPAQKTMVEPASGMATMAAPPVMPASATGPNLPAAARIREVPPEERLEPADIADARLPGGAALPMNPADPVPIRRKTIP